MRLETKYRLLVISMFVILLMFGIYIGFNMGNNKSYTEVAETVINNNTDEDDQVSIYTENEISNTYDIEVVYEDEYTLCNHIIDSSEIIYNTTIEAVKEAELKKQRENDLEYEIMEESKERIVYHRTSAQNCPNHFEVKLEDGIIVIYNIVNDSVNTVYNTIDVPQELISPEMLEELNVGIEASSKEELNLIIEDLES